MIRFEGVGKRFGGKTVLQGLDLHIQAGSFTTVIGGSGSGKTTLLRLINGLLMPDAGRVQVRGQDVAAADLVQLRRSMGYVIQEAGLFPHLRVADNMAYVPHLLGWPKEKIRQRVRELAEAVRLDASLLAHYPQQLSGGQRQRVGIARALAARPDVILMDEPFGAVDEITRQALQAEIKNIWRQSGATIVFITHDIDEALDLGSRLVVLHQGRVAAHDAPPSLIAQPPNTATAELLQHRKRQNAPTA